MKELVSLEARLAAAYEQLYDVLMLPSTTLKRYIPSQDSIVLCVQVAMLIYGMTELLLDEEVSEEWRAHARSESVWKAAEGFGLSITLATSIAHPSLRLVKVVKTHLGKSQPSLADVRTSYDEFIRLLMVRHRD